MPRIFIFLLEDGKVVTLKEMEARYIEYVLKKNQCQTTNGRRLRHLRAYFVQKTK